jgi:putative ABC transport system substrate-binding protein
MRRREFIRLVGAPILWPLAAHAQQPDIPVVGFLNAGSARGYASMSAAFERGLGEAGYVNGRNVTVEYRWADNHYDQLAPLAADLVKRQVAVIAATSTPAMIAAKAATAAIPIVFETAADPVQLGLVASLSRPGGNLTGVTQTNLELTAKRLELLHELLPSGRVAALLVKPDSPVAETLTVETQKAANTLGLELRVFNVGSERDFDRVFTEVSQSNMAGLVVGTGDSFFVTYSERLGALAALHRVPAVYANRRFVASGGLASYGGDIEEAYRLAGVYVGRILKGEKPADLPVQEATKIELRINLRAAKELGLTVPVTLLGRADEVIE